MIYVRSNSNSAEIPTKICNNLQCTLFAPNKCELCIEYGAFSCSSVDVAQTQIAPLEGAVSEPIYLIMMLNLNQM